MRAERPATNHEAPAGGAVAGIGNSPPSENRADGAKNRRTRPNGFKPNREMSSALRTLSYLYNNSVTIAERSGVPINPGCLGSGSAGQRYWSTIVRQDARNAADYATPAAAALVPPVHGLIPLGRRGRLCPPALSPAIVPAHARV